MSHRHFVGLDARASSPKLGRPRDCLPRSLYRCETNELQDGAPFYHSIDGFDHKTKMWTVVEYYADGGREVFTFKADKSRLHGDIAGFTYSGKLEGTSGDGQVTSGDLTSTIESRRKWVITVKNFMIGGEKQPDVTITYERQ